MFQSFGEKGAQTREGSLSVTSNRQFDVVISHSRFSRWPRSANRGRRSCSKPHFASFSPVFATKIACQAVCEHLTTLHCRPPKCYAINLFQLCLGCWPGQSLRTRGTDNENWHSRTWVDHLGGRNRICCAHHERACRGGIGRGNPSLSATRKRHADSLSGQGDHSRRIC